MALELVMVILQTTTLLLLWMTEITSALNVLAKAGCQAWCGNIYIPYPFGIDAGCYISEMYSMECRTTSFGLKPYLKGVNLEVFEILLRSRVQVNNPVISQSCPVNGSTVVNGSMSVDLKGSPFFFLDSSNIFMSVGYNNHSRMIHMNDTTMAQCISICDSSPDRDKTAASVSTATRPQPQFWSQSLQGKFEQHRQGGVQPIPCTYAFLVDRDWFRLNLTEPFALHNLVAGTSFMVAAPPRETRFCVSCSETRRKRVPKRKNRTPKEDGSLSEQIGVIGHKSKTPKPNRTKLSLVGVKSRKIENQSKLWKTIEVRRSQSVNM